MLDKTFFAGHLDEDEEIILVVHKHWIMAVKTLWFATVIFVLTGSILYFIRTKFMVYTISIAELCIAIWWIRNFLDYFLDAWIITDQGVIDLEWHGWFHRSATRVLYSDVQGVSYEVHGVLGTLMNFGEMEMEKISTGSSLTMPYVKRPKKVTSIILKAMENYLHSKNLKDAKTVQGILADFVATSMQQRDIEDEELDDEEYEDDDDEE